MARTTRMDVTLIIVSVFALLGCAKANDDRTSCNQRAGHAWNNSTCEACASGCSDHVCPRGYYGSVRSGNHGCCQACSAADQAHCGINCGNYYWDGSACKACHQTCSSCSGPLATECGGCAFAHYKVAGTNECKACGPNCYACDTAPCSATRGFCDTGYGKVPGTNGCKACRTFSTKEDCKGTGCYWDLNNVCKGMRQQNYGASWGSGAKCVADAPCNLMKIGTCHTDFEETIKDLTSYETDPAQQKQYCDVLATYTTCISDSVAPCAAADVQMHLDALRRQQEWMAPYCVTPTIGSRPAEAQESSGNSSSNSSSSSTSATSAAAAGETASGTLQTTAGGLMILIAITMLE